MVWRWKMIVTCRFEKGDGHDLVGDVNEYIKQKGGSTGTRVGGVSKLVI